MKRDTTFLVLCVLLFVADLIWLRLMFDGRESLASLRSSIAFAGQGLAAATLLSAVYFMMRKKYVRQKRPARRIRSVGFVQLLRRLFAAVLS